MTKVIHCEGLTKIYPGTWRSPAKTAVKDLTLSVEQGEVFGFIGANGAGKSTTIKALTGALRATAGSAELFGVPVADPLARKGLGYVPENPSLYDYLTPLELLTMGLRLHSVAVADERRHCMEWLDRFGLADVARKKIGGFSKGMVQRATLAHSLAIKPRLLILDEPLSGLDPLGRRDVVEILADYKAGGGTIFFTSHVLHDVERLADRFGLIHQGVMVTVRSPAELLQDQNVVLIRSAGANAVEGAAAEAGGRWALSVPSDQVWAALDRLRAAGHSVIEVKPALSLEQAFMKAVGRT